MSAVSQCVCVRGVACEPCVRVQPCVVSEPNERTSEREGERENFSITHGLRFYAVACFYNLSLLMYTDAICTENSNSNLKTLIPAYGQ